jgi:dihydrofolate reductase
MMGRIVVTNNVSLDGVMQAPGGVEEDVRGGFEHGGWAVPYADAVLGAEMAKGMAQSGVLLLGRRTYEHFYSYWPHQTDGNPYTEKLNKTEKYVASTTLREPLPWQNSTLLTGDVATAVAELKGRVDGAIAVLGSGQLVRTLQQHDLIDEYVLLIHPLVLGSGRRLFDDPPYAKLDLAGSVVTGTGVIIATYRRS